MLYRSCRYLSSSWIRIVILETELLNDFRIQIIKRSSPVPISELYYDPRGYGLENYFRYSGFYWTTSGGTTKYRKYMLIQDRKGYDDPSKMNEVNDNLAPIVTIKSTYNYDDMYTWGPMVGCGNAMSVRCMRPNN